jgi:surface antigen
MSSADQRQSSATTGREVIKKSFNLSGHVDSPLEQLPLSEEAPSAVGLLRSAKYYTPPGMTRPLSEPVTPPDMSLPSTGSITSVRSPGVTRSLPEYTSPGATHPLDLQTAILPYIKDTTTTSLRQPVVIRGTGKKSAGLKRPPQGRRWVVQIAVTSLILLITITTLLTVVPINNEGGHFFNPIQSISYLVQVNGGNPSLVAQQAATATAITRQDGFDPGANQAGDSNSNNFPYGQCTYWADYRYHQVTGHYVPWRGNADAWASGARQFGWNVSSKPHLHAIIVLQPGVQGAGWLGHVAFVERVNPDGSVYTSNMNWYAGGGWGRVSYWTFYPGSGVSFVWR